MSDKKKIAKPDPTDPDVLALLANEILPEIPPKFEWEKFNDPRPEAFVPATNIQEAVKFLRRDKSDVKGHSELLPLLFPETCSLTEPRPLALNSQGYAVQLAFEHRIPAGKIRQAVSAYVNTPEYQQSVIDNDVRVRLDGLPGEEIPPEHKEHARIKKEQLIELQLNGVSYEIRLHNWEKREAARQRKANEYIHNRRLIILAHKLREDQQNEAAAPAPEPTPEAPATAAPLMGKLSLGRKSDKPAPTVIVKRSRLAVRSE